MNGYEDSFIPASGAQNMNGYEGSFIPLPNQPLSPQDQQVPVADLSDPSNLGQAEAGQILNSFNNVPGLNLLKEGGAALRGLYAGATAPSDQSFWDAYSQEYDKSRINQDALIKAEATTYPVANTIGKVGAALASMGFLPTPASTGSLIPDAAIGGGVSGGYGVLSGLGNGSSVDDRLKNAVNYGLTGAALGAPLSMVGSGIGQAINGYKNLISPAEIPAVNAALENNIPLYKSNISGSKALDYLSTLSNEIPSVLGGTSGRIPGQQEAIATALTKPLGNASGVLNSDAVDTALATSGKQIGDIIERNDLSFSKSTLDALDNLSAQAAKRMKGDNLDAFNQTIENIKDEVINKTSGNPSGDTGILPGPKYQELRTGMNEDIQNNRFGSTAALSNFTRQARNIVDDAFQAKLPDADALALQKARAIYGNASDLSSVTEGNPTGDYTMGSLYRKLSGNPNYEGPALAAQLLKNQTGNSGTAQRQFIINTAKGLGTAGTGALGLYGEKRLSGDNKNDALSDTLLDVGGAALGAASVGGANRLANPRLTPQNLNGYQFMQPFSSQAQQLADLLRQAAPSFNQLYRSGGK